jgi:hypothetical protein
MKTSKILEYPYCGHIYHVVDGMGSASDTETLLYEGVMDEHQVKDEEGTTMQTASYIISVPWKDYCTCCGGGVTLPKKGDKIILLRYGEEFELRVDNAEPSQIGGISIYASRADW